MAAAKTIRIGFCSQLLCAPPYMVAQAGGFFKAEGLDVEIVNLRGSPAVIQALAGGAIEYGASTFEDVLTAAQHGVSAYPFPFDGEATLVRAGGGTRARQRDNDSGKTRRPHRW